MVYVAFKTQKKISHNNNNNNNSNNLTTTYLHENVKNNLKKNEKTQFENDLVRFIIVYKRHF